METKKGRIEKTRRKKSQGKKKESELQGSSLGKKRGEGR